MGYSVWRTLLVKHFYIYTFIQSDLHYIAGIYFISSFLEDTVHECLYLQKDIIWCMPSESNGIPMEDRHTIGSDLMCGRWVQRLIIEIRQQPAWSNSQCGRPQEESRISILGSSKMSVFELFRLLSRADRFAFKIVHHNRHCCLTHQEASVFFSPSVCLP